jgi:hypothetical protein
MRQLLQGQAGAREAVGLETEGGEMIPPWLQHLALVAAFALALWLVTMSGGRRQP